MGTSVVRVDRCLDPAESCRRDLRVLGEFPAAATGGAQVADLVFEAAFLLLAACLCNTSGVSDERLIAATPSASWLPSGSTAEVWAGPDCAVPEPCIIVRLVLFRRRDPGKVQFFCVLADRGLDLPTLPLGSGSDRLPAAEGLGRLAEQMLGRPEVAYRCIGYVRNVVPHADAEYPHPTPWAHVPVFTVGEDVEPVVDGKWVTLDSARPDLSIRHWWPIVEHHLTADPSHIRDS